MTIEYQYPVVIALGNGVTTSFAYNFEVPYQSDGSTPAVLVQLQNGVLDPVDLDPSLYSINGIGVEAGGTVTYPLSGSPLPTGWSIIIQRNLAYDQPFAFPNTAFEPQQIEAALDYIEMQSQQLAVGIAAGGSVVAGVASFNARTGAVTLTGSDVTTALGYTPVDIAGDSMLGKLNMLAPDTTSAGLRLAPGTDPSAPTDGDLWPTASALKARIGGVTYDLTGGSGFDQDTNFALSTNADGNISLADRLRAGVTLLDYGAVGDGTTDDTAAWNRMVADVNAGNTNSIIIPALTFFLPGDTDQFIHGCSIVGYGDNSILKTTNGTGTSTIIDFDNIPFTEFVNLQDFKMTCTVQPKVRQAIQVTWATESLVFNISNVSMDGAFAKGIGVFNCVVAHFIGVTINLYNYTTNQWGWNFDSAGGRYCVDVRFVSCNVSGAQYGIKGTGHIEGFVLDQCVLGFCAYGLWLDITDTTSSPEVMVRGTAMECIHTCIYISNAADVIISDNWLANDAGSPGDPTIIINASLNTDVHDNVFIGPSAIVWHGVKFTGTSNTARVHDNQYRILSGFGVWCADTSSNIYVKDNHFQAPQAAAQPFQDTTSTNTNFHSNSTSDLSGVNTYFACNGANGIGAPTGLTTVYTIFASVLLPAYAGETFLIQWRYSIASPSVVAQTINCRVREYNHRPTAPIPYTVWQFADNKTTILNEFYLGQSPNPLEGAVAVSGEGTVRVVGTATDALFVLELQTDAGTATAAECGIYVTRK